MDDHGVVPSRLGSLHSLLCMHWDHKPRNWSAGLRPGANTKLGGWLVPGRRPALQFMKRRPVSWREVSLSSPRALVPNWRLAIPFPGVPPVPGINRWLACLALLIISSIQAQQVPKIVSALPDWVQRGATSVVVLEGENLSQINGFLFSGDGGLTATN